MKQESDPRLEGFELPEVYMQLAYERAMVRMIFGNDYRDPDEIIAEQAAKVFYQVN